MSDYQRNHGGGILTGQRKRLLVTSRSVDADGDHVFVGGQTIVVDGCGMLSQRVVVGQVVGWSQRPLAVVADEAEIAGMIVVVAG